MRSRALAAPSIASLCCIAPTVAHADWQTETIAELRVHVYVPSSPRALLIALHGCTQSPDALRDRGKFESPAEAHRAVIALPEVPNGGVIAGCWDYYGSDHSLDGKHHRYLIALVESLLSSMSLDPNRVYLIGLSSGAGEAAVIGCLAPDRFAAIGIAAGPAVGTELSEFGTVATDRDTAAGLCRTLAGPRADGFTSQLTSVIAGMNDFVVARGYARLNAEIMADVYGAEIESALDVTALPGTSPAGEGAIWSDASGPRVSMIVADGLGHAFPAGEGDGLETGFVAQHGVAWPAYVLDFFEENNRRLDRPVPPDAGTADATANSRRDASATDAQNTVDPPSTSDSGCSCRSGAGASALWILLPLFFRRR
jgi:poly(3-hydroxybutyrate) depolymerase